MATLDYSRLSTDRLIVEVDSLWDAVLVVTRDDDVSVNFTGKSLKMDIMKTYGDTPVVTLTSGVDFTISTNTLTFNKTFTELVRRGYDFELYNDTDKVSIMKSIMDAV